MPTSPVIQLFCLLCVVVCLAAMWKGGPAERLGAWCILINLLLTIVAASFLAPSVTPIAQLVLDALTAVGILVIALRFGSLWVGAVMLLYAALFSLHAFYFVAEKPVDFFHAFFNNADFIAVIFCLGIGTVVAARARARALRAAA